MALRMVAAAAAAAAVLVVPAPAQARTAACDRSPPPSSKVDSKAVPYEDQLYDLARLAPLATGAGVRVAVIDSGVDAAHPQLRGQVVAGRDFLRGDSDGRQDCVGHGTGVASVIAARAVDGVPFHGLAPDVTIVPVRISEQDEIGGEAEGESGGPEDLARAIDWAAGAGRARVINLSLTTSTDAPAVRAAVAAAIDSGVVVVAAAGNQGAKGNATPYPTAYPDVIGVGAIGPGGLRAGFSQHGSYVDLVAAGDGITTAALRSGHIVRSGTSFSAPLVAATAALVLQRFPDLTPAQVARRLIATADPAPGGRHSDEYGYGLLNPYRALTESLGPERPASPAPAVVHTEDPATVALRERRDHAQDMSLVAAAAGGGLVVLIGLGVMVVRRGRRRDWRPADPDLAFTPDPPPAPDQARA